MNNDPTGCHFKTLALILCGHKHVSRGAWSDIVKWYVEELKWKGVFSRKLEKLAEKDKVFSEIKEEIGEESAKVIIPLISEGAEAQ